MPSRVIIYGGRGGLGTVLVAHFKKAGWFVASVDLAANDAADANVLVDKDATWQQQEQQVQHQVANLLKGEKVDAILNMAGGWAGGNASAADFISSSELMWKQSVWSSAISAALAAKCLKEGGMLVLPGAQPAVKGTPGMIGYGMAKAAIHQLTQSLAEPSTSGLPHSACVAALLPITLDTPMNRKFMPDADFSTWTPLEFIAELLRKWSAGEDRVKSGSLVVLRTTGGNTSVEIV